jgi:predicted DNA-binding transcriptional regulator YafY
MRPADRLFQIVLLLGRGRVVTARVLAERLEVSERTIYRDIQDLVASGVPIEGEAGVGYVLRRGYQVPPLMFNEEELQALVFGADVARTWGDAELARAADSILAKVDAVLPQRLRPALDSHRLVVPDAGMSSRSSELLGEVRDAINRRVRLFLDYHDAADQTTERIVWPLTLLYWGKAWTLGAWCELRQAFRSFRVDRIHTLNVLSSSFPDEPGKRLEDYLACAGGEAERAETLDAVR